MADIYRVTFKGHYSDGTLVEPSLHYQSDLTIGQEEPDPEDLASAVWAHLTTAYRNATSAGVTIDECVATQEVLKPAIPKVGNHLVNLVGTGSSATQYCPRALVPLIQLKTNTHIRSAHGWQFLSAPGGADLFSGGQWNASGLQAFYDTYAALLNDDVETGSVVTVTWHPVIYSRTRHKRGETPYTFRVTSAVADTHPTWLRSRLSTP